MPKRTVIVVSALVLLASAMVAVVACDKSGGGKSEPTSSSASAASTAPTPLASASAVDTAVSSAAVSVVASPPSPPSSAATASGHVAPKASASAKGVTARVPGKNFVLDATSTGCRVDAQCAMTIRLQTSGDYHVNKEYPYKFTAVATPNVTFLGKGDASVFSRASGDFAEASPTSGVMTVRFKPAGPGEVSLTGTYKLSVCSADQCQIEQQAIALTVTVL